MAYERTSAGIAADAREGNEFMVMFAPGAPPVADRASFDKIAT
jgi:hypothetical protein